MISTTKTIRLKHQQLHLLSERAVFWQKKKILLLADLHIGKSGHFRKHGVAVPSSVNKTNLDVMEKVINKVEPKHLIVLGDLFHSHVNKEWQQFNEWRRQYPRLEVSLVVGNHDILSSDRYHSSYINIFKKLTIDPFVFVHDSSNRKTEGSKYVLGGHVHPAVRLKGKGRQQIKLPCFYFGKKYGILPAFGQFTGTHIIRPNPGDRVFAIAEDHVISVMES